MCHGHRQTAENQYDRETGNANISGSVTDRNHRIEILTTDLPFSTRASSKWSVRRLMQQRLTTGNRNMAAKTRNTIYLSNKIWHTAPKFQRHNLGFWCTASSKACVQVISTMIDTRKWNYRYSWNLKFPVVCCCRNHLPTLLPSILWSKICNLSLEFRR